MNEQDKQQFFKDLCARLPYGVKCQFEDIIRVTDGESDPFYDYVLSARDLDLFINHKNFYIKPYLRPMSSMTEEERKNFIKCAGYEVEESVNGRHYEYYLKDFCGTEDAPCANADAIDWLNAHHFDYRGLIEKGLAIEITKENNPYENNN